MTHINHSKASIDAALRLGTVTLAVRDAARSTAFYRDMFGFQLLEEAEDRLLFGVEERPLIELLVDPSFQPRPRGSTGLYHVAILLPTRFDLAQMLRRLAEAGIPLGASDHNVSEALYLDDPDGNGLEIYRDRPREEWRYHGDGQIVMGSDRLDAEGILAELPELPPPFAGMPGATVIGHMHLKVGDLAMAEAFYHGALGFDVMVRSYHGALFLSAGGYHHHLGLNIWESRNGSPPPADSVGLRAFTLVFPAEAAREATLTRLSAHEIAVHVDADGPAVFDPWGNRILLRVTSLTG
jgi:catechol 2,3-dioxygenase